MRPGAPSSATSSRRSDDDPDRPEQVQRRLGEGAQLVEVLPQDKYEDEHLPAAINIPLKELDRERVQGLERVAR